MTNFRELYEQVYEQYAQDVYRFAFWLAGDSAEAEDITAETFVRAWASRERLQTETLKGYLLTIARNLHLKGWHGRQRLALLDENLADRAPLPEQITAERWEVTAVFAALSHLTELDRTALLLFSQHDLPYAEIGRILNLTPAAAKVRVHRARVKLAAMLEADRG
jgi:RNA polymerase sigma-70 factor, ECF subfamily